MIIDQVIEIPPCPLMERPTVESRGLQDISYLRHNYTVRSVLSMDYGDKYFLNFVEATYTGNQE